MAQTDFSGAADTTLVCFDFGARRIGVAVGQTLTGTATALEVVAMRNHRPDWNRISTIIEQWQPAALVVGDPLNMDGSPQALGRQADRFAARLEGRYGLPVLRAEERLSTFEARDLARQQTKTGAAGKALDPLAAKVILEGWLRQQAPTAHNIKVAHGVS